MKYTVLFAELFGNISCEKSPIHNQDILFTVTFLVREIMQTFIPVHVFFTVLFGNIC